MPPMFGQPWRQAMLAPQTQPYPSGTGFPTQSPTGGWMVPGPPPFQPKPLEKPAPPPPPPPPPPPLTRPPPMFGAYGTGYGGDFGPSMGFAPGMDGSALAGFGMSDGSSGWGGLLGGGGSDAGLGWGYGGSADTGGLAW